MILAAQRSDADALKQIWAQHSRLALAAVNRFSIPETLLPDAIQEGVAGVHRAIMKFEVERYLSFSTYAWYWVTQSIQRFLTKNRFGRQIPSHLYGEYVQFRIDRARYLDRNDWFDFREAWLSDRPRLYESLLRFDRLSRAGPIQTDPGLSASDGDPVELLHEAEILAEIREAINSLTPREAHIIKKRYGLGGWNAATLQTLGLELDMTKQRIQQLQSRAESRLAWHLQHLGPAGTRDSADIADQEYELTEAPDASTDSQHPTEQQ